MPYQGPAPQPIPEDAVDVNAIQQAAVAQALSQTRAMIDQAKADVLAQADQKVSTAEAAATQAGLDAAAAAQQAAVDQAAATTQAAMQSANQTARRMADTAQAAAVSASATASQQAMDAAAVQNKSYTDAQLSAMGLELDGTVADLQKKISDQGAAASAQVATAVQNILPDAKAYADAQDLSMRTYLDSSVQGVSSSLHDAISAAQTSAVSTAASATSQQVQASATALQKQIVDAVNALKSSSVDPLSTQITTLQGQAYKIETRDGIQVPAMSLLNLVGTSDVTVTWVNPFPDASYTITKPQVSLSNVNLIGKVNAEIKSKTKDGCVITVTTTAVLALGTASLSVLAYRKITG